MPDDEEHHRNVFSAAVSRFDGKFDPDILSAVFAVTKEGAWQTVLQHGEGRPKGSQQGGGGRDGTSPLSYTKVLSVSLALMHYFFFFHPSGVAGLPSVSMADSPCGPWRGLYSGLSPPAALLDARVVREIHLHPYHSSWCRSGVATLHGR